MDVEELARGGGDEDGVLDDHDGDGGGFVLQLEQDADDEEGHVHDKQVQQEVERVEATAAKEHQGNWAVDGYKS